MIPYWLLPYLTSFESTRLEVGGTALESVAQRCRDAILTRSPYGFTFSARYTQGMRPLLMVWEIGRIKRLCWRVALLIEFASNILENQLPLALKGLLMGDVNCFTCAYVVLELFSLKHEERNSSVLVSYPVN